MENEVALRKGLVWTPRQIAELGAYGVIRMAFKLCFRSPLLTVHFAIVLPYTIVDLLVKHFQALIINSILSQPPSASTPPITQQVAVSMNMWLSLLLIITEPILLFCVSPVIEAAVFSGAASVCSGANMTLADVFRSVRRLWKRLFVTHVYGLLLSLPPFVIMVFLVWQLVKCHPHWIFMHEDPAHTLLLGFVFGISVFVISILSKLAVGVTCYDSEQRYGWAAYGPALKLLRAKWLSAVILGLIYVIRTNSVAFGAGLPILSAQSFRMTDVVNGVVAILLASWSYQLTLVAWAVFYFSCTEKCQQQLLTHDAEAGLGYQPLATETEK